MKMKRPLWVFNLAYRRVLGRPEKLCRNPITNTLKLNTVPKNTYECSRNIWSYTMRWYRHTPAATKTLFHTYVIAWRKEPSQMIYSVKRLKIGNLTRTTLIIRFRIRYENGVEVKIPMISLYLILSKNLTDITIFASCPKMYKNPPPLRDESRRPI